VGELAKPRKFALVSVFLLIIVFALVYWGVSLTSDLGKSKAEMTAENAEKRLNKLISDISVSTAEPVKGQIDLDPAGDGGQYDGLLR
jgi:Ca-activated chloride channel family protein